MQFTVLFFNFASLNIGKLLELLPFLTCVHTLPHIIFNIIAQTNLFLNWMFIQIAILLLICVSLHHLSTQHSHTELLDMGNFRRYIVFIDLSDAIKEAGNCLSQVFVLYTFVFFVSQPIITINNFTFSDKEIKFKDKIQFFGEMSLKNK